MEIKGNLLSKIRGAINVVGAMLVRLFRIQRLLEAQIQKESTQLSKKYLIDLAT